MDLKFLEIPDTTVSWKVREATRLREKFPTDAYQIGTVLYWKSNDRPVPPHCFKDAFVELPDGQQKAYDTDMDNAVAAYRMARQNYVPSAEERCEMRAAFGPDKTVVDVITGQKWRT